MVNFTLSYIADAGTVSQDSKIYSEANGQRFLDWIWVAYPQLDENGDPVDRDQASEVQAFRDFADGFYAGTKANVLREEDRALKDAATPPPLEPEP